ncbi:hypothetical protein DFR29_101473 [Tahibacter aquaticus]|uniref:Transmembrane protein n=1 Tax=Tahibacter aquaticus TaxID=520092 RepID=A0A4R6ZAW6_9GAMM|nr:hypothetical protein [Tahibacter aquaticus]TDR48849.1 hypothetical protein DFR29_101473 [Tahibacter aquaticus]
MSLLALILFSPWFAILAWVYWRFPARPAGAARRGLDLAALLLALLASAAAMYWAYAANIGFGGAIWKQVIATLWGYAAFLFVLGAAALLRRRLDRCGA